MDTKTAKLNDKKYEKLKVLQKENPNQRIGVLLKKVKLAYPAYRVRSLHERNIDEKALQPNKATLSDKWDERIEADFDDVIASLRGTQKINDLMSVSQTFTIEDVTTLVDKLKQKVLRGF